MASPSLHRVPATQFPAFISTTARSASSLPIPRHFVSFDRRYLGCAPLPRRFGGRASPAGSLIAAPACGFMPRKQRALPRFLGSPLAYMPCSQTPARPPAPDHLGADDVAFRDSHGVGPRGKTSRGSITQPARPLSTLRSRGHPRTTQDSLPAGWPTLAGREWIPAGLLRDFLNRSCSFNLTRLLLAHESVLLIRRR